MIGRTNTGGGGNLSPDSAIICITALANSTISFSKNGVVTKILTSDDGYINTSNNSLKDWYYIIKPSNFGEWVITGVLGILSKDVVVTINNNYYYNIKINYDLKLYDNGVFDSNYDNSNIITSGSITNNATYINLHSNSSSTAYVYKRWTAVDLTYISSIKASFYNPTSINIYISIWVTQSSSVKKFGDATSVVHQNLDGSKSATITLDVSNKTGEWYVASGIDTNNGSWNAARDIQLLSVIAQA